MTELSQAEINEVSGGIICAGFCVLGGIIAGIGLFTAGVSVSGAFADLH